MLNKQQVQIPIKYQVVIGAWKRSRNSAGDEASVFMTEWSEKRLSEERHIWETDQGG